MKYIEIIQNESAFVIKTTNIVNSSSFNFNIKKIKKDNKEVISLLSKNNINTLIFKDFDSFLILSNIIDYPNIVFDINKSLPKKVLDTLLKHKEIKYIECFFIPSDYVHLFSNNNVSIKFTNNMHFNINFVLSNKLKNLKSIYYKKVITFYNEEEVKQNLLPFITANSNLKLIKLYTYSNEIITYIIDLLEENNFDNVSIYLYQTDSNINDIKDNIDYLKKKNKEYSNKEREIKIIYKEEYFRSKIFKELTINGLKLSMIFIIYASIIFMFSSKYHEYINYLNVRKLENELNEARNDEQIDEIDDTSYTEVIIKPNNEKEYVNRYETIVNINKTYEINSDVVAWLKVNNTKINYPVVKTTNNSYYLNHDIYKEKTPSGWVFMDYRNNSKELDKNTIIYAHALKTGYMFGELHKFMNSNFRSNKENLVMSFDLVDKSMNWKVFSSYKVSDEVDYLRTSFSNDESFMSYVNDVKKRSSYNYNVEVNQNSKIITLSTCSGKNRRLVVHAVLVE